MEAAHELSSGLSNLREILASFPPDSVHWNEAENRFQFIDRLLCECLGWQKPDISVEQRDEGGGYVDYLLGNPPKAILEAKRESTHFDLPSKGNPNRLRSLRSLVDSSTKFKEAVDQTIRYCALSGTSIGIVCNGPQLFIFQALIPGMSPFEGECYVFNGLDHLEENFALLWKLMSPEGIAENRANRDLSLHRNPRMPPKASTAISNPAQFRYRNEFQESLSSLSSLLLEDIEDDPELKSAFYDECYVSVDANNRHLLLSKNVIASRYSRVSTSASISAPIAGAGEKDSESIQNEIAVGMIGSRPIVVLGDVGVGKTSFFENLFFNLDQQAKDKSLFIHLDLGRKATLSEDLRKFVISEITLTLKKQYEIDIEAADFVDSIYYEDLKSFDTSVHGKLKEIDEIAYLRRRVEFLESKVVDHDRHLQASLGHLARGQGRNIILIIDNADQRSFETQQQAFLIAQELASSRNMVVFVALRPSTFYVSKTSGALAAYQNRLLTISPPPAERVIQSRLIFAARVAEGKVPLARLESIRLNLGSVVTFLNATLRAVRDNQDIKQFLNNISGGNIRAIVELVTGFFGSPNVDSQKIVEIEEDHGSYKIPLHEFTKHALLGEYAYFNSESSQVAHNIFDVTLADPREHFLSLLIIAYLSSNQGVRDSDGYFGGQQLVEEMCKQGFIEEQVRNAIRLIARTKLIETPHAHFREIPVVDHELPEQFHYRATSVGIYHIRNWAGAFSFLDAMSIDTPIFDDDVREKICHTASSFRIDHRFERASLFRKYLEDQWFSANFPAEYFDFPRVIQSLDSSFASVAKVVGRNTRK